MRKYLIIVEAFPQHGGLLLHLNDLPHKQISSEGDLHHGTIKIVQSLNKFYVIISIIMLPNGCNYKFMQPSEAVKHHVNITLVYGILLDLF